MATHIRTVKIESLQTKHFLSWLRTQQLNGGRAMTVGMIGSRHNNPLELWLQAVTGDRSVRISARGEFTYNGYAYGLSYGFGHLLYIFRSARIQREVSAWEIMQKTCVRLENDAYVIETFSAA